MSPQHSCANVTPQERNHNNNSIDNLSFLLVSFYNFELNWSKRHPQSLWSITLSSFASWKCIGANVLKHDVLVFNYYSRFVWHFNLPYLFTEFSVLIHLLHITAILFPHPAVNLGCLSSWWRKLFVGGSAVYQNYQAHINGYIYAA